MGNQGFEIETKREGFAFWYRNPQYTGQSSLGIAYVEAEQYKIVRPDFLFFAEQDGKMVVTRRSIAYIWLMLCPNWKDLRYMPNIILMLTGESNLSPK